MFCFNRRVVRYTARTASSVCCVGDGSFFFSRGKMYRLCSTGQCGGSPCCVNSTPCFAPSVSSPFPVSAHFPAPILVHASAWRPRSNSNSRVSHSPNIVAQGWVVSSRMPAEGYCRCVAYSTLEQRTFGEPPRGKSLDHLKCAASFSHENIEPPRRALCVVAPAERARYGMTALGGRGYTINHLRSRVACKRLCTSSRNDD